MKMTDQKKKCNKTKGVVDRLAHYFLAMTCVLAVAATLSVFLVSRDAYAEYTKEQYCKEQALLGRNPTICASPTDQQKAKINDPNYDAKASQEEQDFQKAKSIAEGKGDQNKSNNQNKDQNKNNKDQEKKDQEPEHKDDGDGSDKNKSKDNNKDSSGKGSGGGSGGGSGNKCGSTTTFFDWGCNGVDDSKIVVTTLITISNWLAVGATVAVIGGIIYGSIVYATSAGDAAKAKQGIGIIRNAIIALVLYLLMWAILQYAVPGGLFN